MPCRSLTVVVRGSRPMGEHETELRAGDRVISVSESSGTLIFVQFSRHDERACCQSQFRQGLGSHYFRFFLAYVPLPGDVSQDSVYNP